MSYSIPVYRVLLVKEGQHSVARKVAGPQDVAEVLCSYLDGADREHFVVVLLDTKNRVIGLNTVAIGGLNSASVSAREVFKPAILSNAASIVLGHNHPSGDPQPSSEDVQVTRDMVKAGELLGVSVLDHVIVGDGYVSLKERKVIPW